MPVVVPHVAKITRASSTTAAVARPSHLLRNGTRVAASTRQTAKDEARSDGADPSPSSGRRTSDATTTTRPITSTSSPRPTAATPRQRRTPLMQGFTTSAPRPSRPVAASRIDACVLPSMLAAPYDPYANVRVPLLPTVRAASVAGRAVEEPDRPRAPAEIVVLAADPDNVAVAALAEVEGFGVEGMDLAFAHAMEPAAEGREERGMIRDVWKGLMDHVYGPGAGGGKMTTAL